MTPFVLACVIGAAILHASWNAVLRGGDDRLWSMTLMMIAVIGVTGMAATFVPWPSPASWPHVLASALIHVGYNLSLVQPLPSPNLPLWRSRPDLPYFAWLVASPCRTGGLSFRTRGP